MEQEQQKEWFDFEMQTANRIRAEYNSEDAECLFRIVVNPSFHPLINWRVCRGSSRANKNTFFALYSRWRRDVDAKKFATPVERLKHPRQLTPTIEYARVELSKEFVENIMTKLEATKVPGYVSEHLGGCDGTFYELSIGNFFLRTAFCWWVHPPTAWQPLEKIVNEVLEHLETLLNGSLSSESLR